MTEKEREMHIKIIKENQRQESYINATKDKSQYMKNPKMKQLI